MGGIIDRIQHWFADDPAPAAQAAAPAAPAVQGPSADELAAKAAADANLAPEDAGPDAPGKPIAEKPGGGYDISALKDLPQMDGMGTTAGDEARCSAQGTAAALLMKGKDGVLGGVKGARDAIEARIAQAGGSKEARGAWASQLARLDEVERHARDGQLTTNDVNHLASVLYQTFDTDKKDKLMTYADVSKMQTAVGLKPEAKVDYEDTAGGSVGQVQFNVATKAITGSAIDANKLTAAKKRVADDVLGSIGKGDTASVAVFNPSNPGSGATDKPNHFVLVGKSKTGEPFVYDSLANPSYYSGNAAKSHLASRIGVSFQNEQVSGGNATYDLRAAAPVIVHPKS